MSPGALAWTDLLEEHAGEAAFLAELRSQAFVSYRQTLTSLAELDERLLAHLDGLLVAPDAAWELAGAGLTSDQPGEAFVAAWLALAGGDDAWTDALEGALVEPASLEGLSGALRLARGEHVERRLTRLASREDLVVRALALDALAFRGRPAGAAPARALLESGHPVARMAGINVAARGRLRDLRPLLSAAAGDPQEWLAARALQAMALLADREAAALARGALRRPDRAGAAAIRLLGLIGASGDVAAVAGLATGAHAREALIALGRLGEPSSFATLLDACEDPKRARAAGHGFEILTGARLEAEHLSRPPAPPSDEEEEALEFDPDDGLAWPDPARVRTWWEARGARAKRGARWRRGEPFDWEAVAREASDELAPLPDRDDALMELSSRLAIDHAERRDWATNLRASLPGAADVRRRARERDAQPWPSS